MAFSLRPFTSPLSLRTGLVAPMLALAALTSTACSSDSSDSSDSNDGASGTGGATTGTGGASTGVGGQSSGGAAATGGAASTGSAPGTGGGADACASGDTCPATNGVTWECKSRFMYGANWAWKNWGADFGGITAWGTKGVSQDSAAFDADMATLRASGTSVIRWWMWPRFLTDSITWDSDDSISGIGGTLIADVQKALELADKNDVYLMLTPFSFDNFKITADEAGINSRSLGPMVADDAKRAKVIENLMRPVAQAIEASPYKKRMIAWDLINEPEWAMTGANPNDASAPFEPQADMDAMTHAQMKTFLDELTVMLREEGSALVTIGSAAIKWGNAWKDSDVDFYSLHYYDWVYQYFPYTTVTPASKGLTGKPVVMGEFPYAGVAAQTTPTVLPARNFGELVGDLMTNGYSGALGWSFNDEHLAFDAAAQKTFADAHACETAY